MSDTAKLLVLGAVKILQPVHGYDVQRELKTWNAHQWANLQPGSIYHQLRALTKDRRLERVATEKPTSRPERTTYQVTAEGDQEFYLLLRATFWQLNRRADELIAALCFLPWLTRDEAIAALRARITQAGTYVESMEYWDPEQYKPDHIREVFTLSETRLKAESDWAARLIEKLQAGEYVLAGEPDGCPLPPGRR